MDQRETNNDLLNIFFQFHGSNIDIIGCLYFLVKNVRTFMEGRQHVENAILLCSNGHKEHVRGEPFRSSANMEKNTTLIE